MAAAGLLETLRGEGSARMGQHLSEGTYFEEYVEDRGGVLSQVPHVVDERVVCVLGVEQHVVGAPASAFLLHPGRQLFADQVKKKLQSDQSGHPLRMPGYRIAWSTQAKDWAREHRPVVACVVTETANVGNESATAVIPDLIGKRYLSHAL